MKNELNSEQRIEREGQEVLFGKRDLRGPGRRPGAGRKRTTPPGSRVHALRCTDDEFLKVKTLITQLRTVSC